jgi:hypothetical protein
MSLNPVKAKVNSSLRSEALTGFTLKLKRLLKKEKQKKI